MATAVDQVAGGREDGHTDDALSGRFVRRLPDGRVEAQLVVPGMHCAGCLAKVERALDAEPAVARARANLTTKRATVAWDPARGSLDGLIARLEATGFDAAPFDPRLLSTEDGARERGLLRAMAVAGFAMANVMLLSVSVWAGLASDMDVTTRGMFHWISALIVLPAVAYAGQPFFRSAWSVLRRGRTNMDVPISLAVLLATAASLFETVRNGEHVYFDAAIGLLFFLLIGRFLDQRMRAKACSAAQNLLGLRSVAATVVEPDGRHRTVPVDAVAVGQRVHVAAGMRIPADGTVEDGVSEVDTSLISGEPVPEPIGPGTAVFAGTLNLSGPVTITVTARDEDSLLADIVRLMEAAEQGRSDFVRIADRLARAYAPVVHVLAAVTFAGWLIAGAGWHPAMMAAVGVLIITCPCALALAVPVVQVVATGKLLDRGVLVKSADALERLADVDTVGFDKTGTLTTGDLKLVNAPDIAPADLGLAGALARTSRHPLAVAVAHAAADGPAPVVNDVRELPGQGLEGRIDGATVRLGSRAWAGPGEDAGDGPAADGAPELWLRRADGRPVQFAFSDALRPDAADVVQQLTASGQRVALASGDREPAVRAVADRLTIADWQARATPADKIARLDAARDDGRRVLMVGDGLNDAPALRAAHVSMSPASAADISQVAADLVFQGANLAPVPEAIDTARRARRLVFQNFALAFAYNAVAIPLAMAGLVTPLVAAIAMSSSSLLVTLNAMRLRWHHA